MHEVKPGRIERRNRQFNNNRDFNSLFTKTDRKTTKKSAWTEMTKMMLSNNLL